MGISSFWEALRKKFESFEEFGTSISRKENTSPKRFSPECCFSKSFDGHYRVNPARGFRCPVLRGESPGYRTAVGGDARRSATRIWPRFFTAARILSRD